MVAAHGAAMNAREEMLGRIRRAAGSGLPPAAGEVPRGYRSHGDLHGSQLLDLLTARLTDYRCSVRRCCPGELASTIAASILDRGARSIVLPPGLGLPLPDPATAGADLTLVADDGFSAECLDGFDAVITTATVAIAETGTIALDGSAGQGRRALTLIPDYHLCVVYEHQVVCLVPEALAVLTPQRPLTWISGPSATSDIEFDRVEGVHGPRALEVILVAADEPARAAERSQPCRST
jgi:L-lactate dehydrogenase complex protein LldG